MPPNYDAVFSAALGHVSESAKQADDAKAAADHLSAAVRLLNSILLSDYELKSSVGPTHSSQAGKMTGSAMAASGQSVVDKATQMYPSVYAKLVGINSRLPFEQRAPVPSNVLDTIAVMKGSQARNEQRDREINQLVTQIMSATSAEAGPRRSSAGGAARSQRTPPQHHPVGSSSSLAPPANVGVQARSNPRVQRPEAQRAPAPVSSREQALWTGQLLPSEYASVLQRSGLQLGEDVVRDLVSETRWPQPHDNTSPDPFDAVVGQAAAKEALMNSLILPRLRPDVFTGNRQPPSSILLLGPPGCGKTFIMLAAAEKAGMPMVCLSASSIMSKYVGESEQRLRAFFQYCSALGGPQKNCIMFVDEADSILTSRGDSESESARRVKTEFLTLTQGVLSGKYATMSSGSQDRSAGQGASGGFVLVAATNRPMDLDDAVLRRFDERVLIRLPGVKERKALLAKLLARDKHSLKGRDIDEIAKKTDGYSYNDLTQVVKKAAMIPLRALLRKGGISSDAQLTITREDYEEALKLVRPTVSARYMGELEAYMR